MGNNQSDTRKRDEEQRKQLEIQRKLREEEDRRIQEEKDSRKAAAEEKRHKLQLEKELENKKLDLKHAEEMQRISASEKSNEREAAHLDKVTQLEHERLSQNQDKVLSIVGDLFKKVEIRDMQEAAFGVTVLQSIQAGKPVDKDVLKAVTAKVQDPPPTDIKRLVHKIIETCAEEDGDGDDLMSHPTAPPRRHTEDLMENID